MGDFTMPSLGADMEAGTVTEWLVKPGDHVKRGDIVAVVQTEKSTIEVEIFESGVIEQLLVEEGERVPVGTVLAHVAATAQAPAQAAPRVPADLNVAAGLPPTAGPSLTPGPPAPPSPPAPVLPAGSPVLPAGGPVPPAGGPVPPGAAAATPTAAPVPSDGPRVPPAGAPATHGVPPLRSPLVRHLADRLGVDISTLAGSGPGGLVTRADVQQAAGAPVGRLRPAGRRPSSPLSRRLAAELGLDLSTLEGSGPGGAVLERDVRAAATAKRTQAPWYEAAPLPPAIRAGTGPVHPEVAADAAAERRAAMRRAIGALMARSKREIPHYYLSTTVDVATCTTWLEDTNRGRPVTNRLVLAALLIKATALAVAKVPEMNGFFVDGVFAPSESVHVGVAISLRGGGVIAPAIHDADKLALDELMSRLRDLVDRARAGVLRSSEMSDPTITVSNLGDLGVETVFGVIYPPQVALVGFGQVVERVVAKDGMLGIRPCLTATLSADHRASDGHRGGRFLAQIDRLLQEPEKL